MAVNSKQSNYLSKDRLFKEAESIFLLGATAASAAFVLVPALRNPATNLIFGCFLVLFAPGYAFVAAMLPERTDLQTSVRLGMSFCFSIIISGLSGFGLALSPLRLSLGTFVACIVLISVSGVTVARVRRTELASEGPLAVNDKTIQRFRGTISQALRNRSNMALVIVVVFCISASTPLVAYIAMTPKDQPFTDFYILGPNGVAADYPTQYRLGTSQPVTIGIENHEHRDMQYAIVVVLNSSTRSTTLYSTNVSVGDTQTWRQTIQVKPDQVGDHMKLAFLLYADNNYATPYRELHTWVNVTA